MLIENCFAHELAKITGGNDGGGGGSSSSGKGGGTSGDSDHINSRKLNLG